MTGKFGISSANDATVSTTPTGKFGISVDAPTTEARMLGQLDDRLYRSALAKRQKGLPLTREEAGAVARFEAGGKIATKVGEVVQPLFILSDLTKGIIGELQGTPGSLARGGRAAASHLTWGVPDTKLGQVVFPGLVAARAQGVTGAELLVGTKYEGDATAALVVEVFADPSVLLAGAGLVGKTASTVGRLTQLEKLAQTPAGAAKIRDVLMSVDRGGNVLLRASDEVTGIPTVARTVAKSPVGQAVKGRLAAAADTQLPNFPGSSAIRAEGGGTVGDAFLTPDQKASIYTPEQLARDEFRDGVRLGGDQTAAGIKDAALVDARVAAKITTGLKPADATEVTRLLGVFSTATDPAVAAEALRKLSVVSARTGKNLEPAFVDAVKALDRISQDNLGANLAARGLPVVVDPVVTKAIQDAQTGADLVPLIGRYATQEGRPRGIIQTQYVGRADPTRVVQDLGAGPEIPALATVDAPKVQATLDANPVTDPLPVKPLEPVGVAGAGELPRNAPGVAERIVQNAAPTPAPAAGGVTPAQVLEELFNGKAAGSDLTSKPLTVYHGTSIPFDTFDFTVKTGKGEGGVFFAEDPTVAHRFASTTTSSRDFASLGQSLAPDRPVDWGETWNGDAIKRYQAEGAKWDAEQAALLTDWRPGSPVPQPDRTALDNALKGVYDVYDANGYRFVNLNQYGEGGVVTELDFDAVKTLVAQGEADTVYTIPKEANPRVLEQQVTGRLLDLTRPETIPDDLITALSGTRAGEYLAQVKARHPDVWSEERNMIRNPDYVSLPKSPKLKEYLTERGFVGFRQRDSFGSGQRDYDSIFVTDPKAVKAPGTPPQNVLSDLLNPVPDAPPAPRTVPEAEYEAWAQGQLSRIGTVTPDEAAAVTLYAADGNFGQINRFLRGDTDEVLTDGTSPQRVIDQIDSLMARATISEPVTVWRGIPMGRTSIGLRVAAAKGELGPGTVFPQQAYSSATVSEQIASRQFAGGGTVFEIELPAGAQALPLGKMGIPDEAEVLLPRGQNLVIREAAERDGTLYIKAGLENAPVAPAPGAARPGPLAALVDQALSNPTTLKTPQSVLDDLLAPPAADPLTVLPAGGMTPTLKADTKGMALPATEAATPRLVERAVPSTYRTVEIDANALDWGGLPDDAARRAVLNSIEGAGNARFAPDATGNLRMDRPNLTVPLDHPVISRYFSDSELMAAQRQGTTLGERVIARRMVVPDWYNPRDPAPFSAQQAAHEAAVREAAEQAYPNDARHLHEQHEIMGDDSWILGDAFASWNRPGAPSSASTRAAMNDFAQRVAQITGRPATKGEVFQYRLQLARYQQAVNLRNLNTTDVADHLTDFYKANPQATLYEGVLSAARQFNLGRAGARHLQTVLRDADSGFARQMSTLERKEFAQMMLARDATQRAGAGLLVDRLTRNPQAVSAEFEQVFAQDVNALRLIDDQVRTRTAAIVRNDAFRAYRDHLTNSGQLVTAKKLKELRAIPEHRLTPDQRALRDRAASAVDRPGAPAGWKVMDRNVEGFFEKGDVIPWWAYFDLFGAKSVDDAAVASRILDKGRVYDRAWSAMNARMLGSFSSVVNDQVGQMLQMGMWGVTPDAVIEGMIRRGTASADELATMRASGIQSASLEHNIGADREALRQLAQRLDGDTDLTRTERVVDGLLRFAERGTGINPQAMTGAAGVAADVASFGSGYVFRARSKMSDLQRESLYFHRLQLGDTPAKAARYANTVMLDMRLVPAYARVVRRFWPFFNWIAMSGPRSIVTVLRKPGITGAYQRFSAATDDPNDRLDDTRRVLAREGGWLNLNWDERGGARVYINPKNWDPTNTIPQLLDWSGTKVGAVSLPWYLQLTLTIQGGQDRFGRNIYSEVLDGQTGGYTEAARIDPKRTAVIAAKAMYQQFNPSYAPGSPRARAFVRSVLATADLPDDGSKDVTIAKTLADTPAGRAYLLFLQSGSFAGWAERDLEGTRESPYTDAAPSMARAGMAFLVPVQGVNPDQQQQGTALQKLAVEKLNFQNWLAGERKRLATMEAGGATRERIRQEEQRIEVEAERRGGRLGWLDQITRK